MHIKNEIVAIARGYYALPILISLARSGITDRLLEGSVDLDQLSGNRRNLKIVLDYLCNLGWLRAEDGRYRTTQAGTSVLRRSGAFGILYSYRPYMANLDQLLFDTEAKVQVYRDENVVGSGAAHIRKYFSRVSDLIEESDAGYVLDIGCGDGTFLNHCRGLRPDIGLIGVDYSERALEVTRARVPADAVLFQGNVSEPEVTRAKLERRGIDPAEIIVSVWFIFHEVLGMEGIDLTRMLGGYRQLSPEHGLIIGEIFDVPRRVLAAHHNDTAIPEFNLFHDLSGQKLFTLDAWQQAIATSGFQVDEFVGLDPLSWEDSTYYGSAIWKLS